MSKLPPSIPRAAALSRVVGSFYSDHLAKEGRTCRCEQTAPDPSCDSGEALWRLQAKEMLRFDDGRLSR